MSRLISPVAVRFRVLVVVVGLVASSTSAVSAAVVSTPPNVVVIFTDDQTFENQRVMAATNRLLGERGTTFSNAVVNVPVCCPSRATLLTGQHSRNHGVLGNHWPRGGYAKLDHSNTLATWLDEAGYFTAFTGKFMNEYGAGQVDVSVPPGWDDWFVHVGAGNIYGGYTISDDGVAVHFGDTDENYSTDVYGEHAQAVIEQAAGDDPFFLMVGTGAPHGARNQLAQPARRHVGVFDDEPLPVPPSFNERDVSDKPAAVQELPRLERRDRAAIRDRYRRRLESLLAVDELVSDVFAALEATGEIDNTLVIFTSDNGWLEGQHRIPAGKSRVYEESIRVPLIIMGPGFPAGATIDVPVSNIDIAPTIVAATGATARRSMDGVSLLDIVSDAAAFSDRHLLVEMHGSDSFSAVRTSEWIYVENTTGEIELYDLRNDPHQLASRHNDHSVAHVRARLAVALALLRGG